MTCPLSALSPCPVTVSLSSQSSDTSPSVTVLSVCCHHVLSPRHCSFSPMVCQQLSPSPIATSLLSFVPCHMRHCVLLPCAVTVPLSFQPSDMSPSVTVRSVCCYQLTICCHYVSHFSPMGCQQLSPESYRHVTAVI